MYTNKIVQFAVVAAAAAVLASSTVDTRAQQAVPESRVVIQVSDADPGKWNLALNNARNLQTDLGAANVAIEIVGRLGRR